MDDDMVRYEDLIRGPLRVFDSTGTTLVMEQSNAFPDHTFYSKDRPTVISN